MASQQWIVSLPEESTNLRVLRPSRRKPKSGDLFVMQLRDERFLFGRVISSEAVIGPMRNAILIYIYRPPFDSREPPDRAKLSPERLLLSPLMTNRLPWSKGYFETVAQWPLEPSDVLPQNCFLSAARGRYYDEKGTELGGPVEPVGDWGLHSYRTIDDEISDVLGIERAPD